MVVETLTKESLETWLKKGISNVAFLSIGLGLKNAASIAFAEAKVWSNGSDQRQEHNCVFSLNVAFLRTSCGRHRERRRGGGGRE